MDIRYDLLSTYLDELWSIKGLPPMSDKTKREFYAEVTGNAHTEWIDIRDANKNVGFLIVGTPPNCHPDADFYIEEAYIKPEHRRKGLMCSAVTAFVQRHQGTYCMFILNRNEPAKRFWYSVFSKRGYMPCFLRNVGAGDKYCTQYGFAPANWRQ